MTKSYVTTKAQAWTGLQMDNFTFPFSLLNSLNMQPPFEPSRFGVVEHIVPCQHIREYPQATTTGKDQTRYTGAYNPSIAARSYPMISLC